MLKIIPKNSVLPILQGRLKGKKWIIGSGVFGYWLGTYEWEKQKLFETRVETGDIVYDVGAHAGFYTLLAAELVGEKGRIFSFEPNPRNIVYLKKHIRLNNYKNIEVFETAASEKTGSHFFSAEENSFYGKISKDGRLEVKTVALDDLIGKGKLLPPDVIKIDVEGAELAVLRGAAGILRKYRPVLFLSTHGREIHELCLNFLASLGYNFEVFGENEAKTDKEVLVY
ncbi:MAG: FkbM family methyltransferase [Candidatus Paceibacterota bacterium]